MPTTSTASISDVIDDIWISIFCHLSMYDLIKIRAACSDFHKISNPSVYKRMNQYWHFLTVRFCCNIELQQYHSQTRWDLIYKELHHYFLKYSKSLGVTFNNITKEIVNPVLPLHLPIQHNCKSPYNSSIVLPSFYRACIFDSIELFKVFSAFYNLSDNPNITLGEIDTQQIIDNYYIYNPHAKISEYSMMISPLTHKNKAAHSPYSSLTPLEYAVNKKSYKIVKYLLSMPNIDIKTKPRQTRLLQTAVKLGCLKICEILLTHEKFDCGLFPAYLIIELLRECSISKNGSKYRRIALLLLDRFDFKLPLACGYDQMTFNYWQHTRLLFAVLENMDQVASQIVKKLNMNPYGIDMNSVNGLYLAKIATRDCRMLNVNGKYNNYNCNCNTVEKVSLFFKCVMNNCFRTVQALIQVGAVNEQINKHDPDSVCDFHSDCCELRSFGLVRFNLVSHEIL